MATEHARSPSQIVHDLWTLAGADPNALINLRLTGEEPALPSSFRVGALAQATIAATGLAAAEIWRRAPGSGRPSAVDMRHAAIEFRSERYMRIDGKPPGPAWDKIAGIYATGDGRKVRLHTNFPHHRDGILKLLGCAYEREAVQAALMQWEAEKFETAAAEAGLVATMMRSPAEWAAHPQGQAVAACRCSRSPGSARRRRAGSPPSPRTSSGAPSPASACSTSRASSPVPCADARLRPMAPMSCA